MAFTYTDTLATDRDRVRFHLQDTVENSGPKPSDANFTDNEIDGLVTLEGSWQRAVAAGFEALTAAWRKYADTQVGPRREMYHLISQGYAADAKRWRADYGRAASASTASTGWVTRVDGYSDDVSAGEV